MLVIVLLGDVYVGFNEIVLFTFILLENVHNKRLKT